MGHGLGFRVAGIPVLIDPTFLLVAVLLGWGVRSGALLVSWVIIVTGSVLLHELGHAFAFRRYGREPQILLQGMGGLTSAPGELTPRRDVVVSLAGPLTGLVLLGLPALYYRSSADGLSSDVQTILTDLVFVNLAWSVLNLLPVLPLDGGRVSAALWSLGTGGRGDRQAHILSVVVAGGAAVLALANGLLFGALFAGFFAAYNVSRLTASRNLGLQQQLVGGWQALASGNGREAEATAQQVLAGRPSAETMGAAMELQAWSRLIAEDVAGARAALQRFPSGRDVDPLLLGALDLEESRPDDAVAHVARAYAGRPGIAAPIVAAIVARAGLDRAVVDRLLAPDGPGASAVSLFAVHLHAAGRFDEAVAAGRRALDAGADGQGRVAYNLACSHARADQDDLALEWLERAIELGFADATLLDTDPDLDQLRRDDRFSALRARLSRRTEP